MNIVFFGSSEFAIPAFEALINSRHKILAVVTQPDRKKGRSLKLSPPPVKVWSASKNIPVYQPQDASGSESIEYLKELGPDLFVVVSFGQILKEGALSVPRLFAINLHGSLLPKYRGAAPTNWAIIEGQGRTGVTVIRMNERMDEGDIILTREVDIDQEETNITLSEKLSDIGAKALVEAVDLIQNKKANFTGQDGSKATYAPKLTKKDGQIDWKAPAKDIHNRVKGLIPWPGAYTRHNGRILKIWKTKLSDIAAGPAAKAGEVLDIVEGKGIIVNTGLGAIAIQHLQLEGKKILDADSFVRGHRLAKGYEFGKV